MPRPSTNDSNDPCNLSPILNSTFSLISFGISFGFRAVSTQGKQVREAAPTRLACTHKQRHCLGSDSRNRLMLGRQALSCPREFVGFWLCCEHSARINCDRL